MKKEAKIKSSIPMIIGRVLSIVVVIVSVGLLLLLLVPDGEKIVKFNDETEVRESLAYYCSVKSLETIMGDDTIEEVISICFICPNDSTFDYTSVKVVYNNGKEKITRYFETDYGTTMSSPQKKLFFNEIDENQHRINARFLIFPYLFPEWKDNDMREREYDDFAVNVILNDAKENSQWH